MRLDNYKFRAYHKKMKLMSKPLSLFDIQDAERYKFIFPNKLNLTIELPLFHPELVIMQYIGMEDIRDQAIYEDDIVEMTIEPTPFNKQHFNIQERTVETALVIWNSEFLSFELQFHPLKQWHPLYECMRLVDSDAIVIGNKHENPELL